MPVTTYVVPSNKIVHETKVDFSYRSAYRSIRVVQYDKQLPIVAVSLYVSGNPYTIPVEFNVNVRMGKRDKTFVSKPVLGCNAERNVVYFEVDGQMTYFDGPIYPILELTYYDGLNLQKAGSSAIHITVERNPVQEYYIQSNSEYIDLVEAVENAERSIEEKDGVLEYVNFSSFPSTGITGKLYISKDTNKIYRWNGSGYVEFRYSLDENGNRIIDTYATKDEVLTEETLTHETGESVSNLPIGTLEGAVDNLVIEGNLLDAPQLVTNGDFNNGTTGWSLWGATGGVVNGIYSFTPTEQFGRINYLLPSQTINTKYYTVSKLKTSSNKIHLIYPGNVMNIPRSITHSGSGNYELLSFITTVATTTITAIQISDFRTSEFTQIDVEFVYRFNISTLITNKQYSPLFNTTFDLMSDADIKTQMDTWVQDGVLPNDIQAVDFNKRVRSVGKNLFDGELELGDISWAGYLIPHDNRLRSINFIKVEPYTTYYLYGGPNNYQVNSYDINKEPVLWASSAGIEVDVIGGFTTPKNCAYIKIVINGTADVTTKIMLNKGTTPLSYEPYRSSDFNIIGDYKGYRVPNGVKDTIEFRNGKVYHVQRVKKYVLQSDNIGGIADLTYLQYVVFNFNNMGDIIGLGNIDYTATKMITEISSPLNSLGVDDVANVYKHHFNPSNWLITFPLGTYATLAEAKADLTGLEIYYQLATPIETEVLTNGELISYPNGTLYIDGTLTPRVSFDVPINVGSQIKALNVSADYQAKQIMNKANIEQEDWLEPTLLNGWANFGAGYETPGYYKDNFGVVHVKGFISNGIATSGTIIFTFSDGYRPKRVKFFSSVSNGSPCALFIDTDGNLKIDLGNTNYITLDGISFKVGE